MQVLIVEDNEIVAHSISRALGMLDPDQSMHIAGDLRSACDYLDRGNKADVALVDLGLPDAAGIEAPTALHMIDPEMPIIVISGSETSHLRLDLLRDGIQDYVPKGEATAARILRAISAVRARKRREETLRHRRLIKETNGALNKLGFYAAIRRCQECAERLGIRCGLLAVELTGFEQAVADHGEAAGEILVRQACGRISHVIRHCDALGRGGDKLLYVLLNGISDAEAMAVAAGKIRARFDTPLHVNAPVPVSAAVGGALFPGGETTVREWLRRAAAALAEAKTREDPVALYRDPDLG